MGPAGSGPGWRAESIRGGQRPGAVGLVAVAASSSPSLPWHQSHHALQPSHLLSELPNLPSNWSSQARTGASNQRPCQMFSIPFKDSSKTYLYIWHGIGKICTANRHPGIQGFATDDPSPRLPSGCPYSNCNQMCCFLRQDGRRGRRKSDIR